MTAAECKQMAIDALSRMKGDDLERAKAAARRMTVQDYQEKEYGQSGKSLAMIVEEYQAHRDKVCEAIEWVKGVKV